MLTSLYSHMLCQLALRAREIHFCIVVADLLVT